MFTKLLLEIALIALRGLMLVSVAVLPTLTASPAPQVQAPVVMEVAAPEAISQPAAPVTEALVVESAPAAAPDLFRVIDPNVIRVDPDGLPAFLLNQTAEQKLTITGGAPPYTLSISEGTMPAGLELKWVDVADPGVDYWAIGGTPTAVTGPFGQRIVIYVLDNEGGFTWKTYDVIVVGNDAPPQITYTIDGVLGNNGWFVSDVTVDFTVVDDIPVDLTNCPDVTITIDQMETTYTCTVPGALPVTTFPIKRDATRPVINNLAVRAYDANDWYNAPVTFTPECNDPKDPEAAADVIPSGILPGTCDALTYSGPDVKGQVLTFITEDAAGNKSDPWLFTLNYDATDPVVNPGVPNRPTDHNGWYNHDVLVVFTGTDATSGIASCTESLYTGPDSFTAFVMGTCTDNAGNTAPEIASVTFQFDKTPPQATVTVNDNQPVLLHQPDVEPVVVATDNMSGVDTGATVCGTVDTSSVGYKEVECTVYDVAGNSVVAKDGYNVVYDFEGFFRPVSEGWNEENAGRTLPIKFHLADYYGVDQDGAMVLFGVWEADCDTGAFVTPLPEGEDIYPDLQPQQHGRYHYNWDTTKDMEGMCRVVVIDLGEGAGFEHTFLVKFK